MGFTQSVCRDIFRDGVGVAADCMNTWEMGIRYVVQRPGIRGIRDIPGRIALTRGGESSSRSIRNSGKTMSCQATRQGDTKRLVGRLNYSRRACRYHAAV